MKKTLLLAAALSCGLTATTMAANPFSDVPAGHWAYDSVAKLAAAGAIEGYGDSTFGGDRLMTRYEMAQIVARAMAKGADCSKLAAEFADELDNLGVRVANLEKKADNVRFTGTLRAHYKNMEDGAATSVLRTRILVNGKINEDWSYTGRLQNINTIHGTEKAYAKKEDTAFNWAYVTGKIGGAQVAAGRLDFRPHTGFVLDNTFDGVQASYGKKVKVTASAGKASYFTEQGGDRLYILDVATKLGVVDVYATYYNVDAIKQNEGTAGEYKAVGFPSFDQKIYVLGASTKIAKDLVLNGEWYHGESDMEGWNGDKDGYAVGLAYKKASASAPGSWGVYANYFDQPQMTYLRNTIQGYTDAPVWADCDKNTGVLSNFSDGFKGIELGVNVALAKNIVARFKYYDLDARSSSADAKCTWTDVTFSF